MIASPRLALSALAGATLCLTGCFTIDKGHLARTGDDHILVSNYGWYLFHFIPIANGNANPNRWLPWVMFRDDVTMDKIQRRFMNYADALGKSDIRDLSYTTRESVMLEIPWINIPLPVPYLLTYREIQLSGVAR